MAAVEPEMNASVRPPRVTIERNNFTIRDIDHGKIPQQHVDSELPITPHQIMQKISKAWRTGIAGMDAKPAIKLPARDKDKLLSAFKRRRYRGEIGCAVHQKRYPIRACNAAAVFSFHADS